MRDPAQILDQVLREADALIHQRLTELGLEFPHLVVAVISDGPVIWHGNVSPDGLLSFVEDLIQRDKISHKGATDVIPAELTSPGEASPHHKTHYVIREDGKTVLRRHHFDCGFRGCNHSH